MKQTLIYKHNTDTGSVTRLRIVAGDCVAEINNSPSCSFSGENYYTTGKLVTAAMRKTTYYKTAQFDYAGNSDWLI